MASYDVFEPLFTNQFIGGEWTASSSPNRIAVENPATLEKFAEIPDGTVEDIDRAVDAAYDLKVVQNRHDTQVKMTF